MISTKTGFGSDMDIISWKLG